MDDKKGFIQLYKVNYNKNYFKETKIEFVKDITLEINKIKPKNFNGFQKYITCITQQISHEKKIKILVTCSNGNVYLITYKNLNFLILKDLPLDIL